ncbi:hypothetical protein [Mycobacterium spongiae]|uniref:Uncharacterized protein n=1 Tax=Mycobacterium spongiae TaxID=886343 RepID=A0A975JVK4_9MYCO|nr:hypothetical protein [Mycobacterium spongiae]QUR66497.1 hypothetical protein F6B93_04800 [Mycobacterium spongiae]
MSSIEDTVAAVIDANTWDRRVNAIRLIPEQHGKTDQPTVYADIARQLYVPNLAPDFAFVHDAPFYDEEHFDTVYAAAESATEGFTRIGVDDLAELFESNPQTLLVFRTITGLLKNEFALTTTMVVEQLGDGSAAITPNTIDAAEKKGRRLTNEQSAVLARTIDLLMRKQLFADPPLGLHSKQDKFDTRDSWDSVRHLATNGVPYRWFLHQRHYGGAFGQVTNATSGKKGDSLEDEVEALFKSVGVPYIRTGSHNQGEIVARFGVTMTPAPDFVIFDATDTLRAMLECKSTNDGGTARDKATRFRLLQTEGARLGGVPVIAVLGGTGWARVNDTLGPVLQYTDGRVFTLETLDQLLAVTPFPQLLSSG